MNKNQIANNISDYLNPLVISLILLAAVSINTTPNALAALGWFTLVVALNILPVLLIAILMVRTGRMDTLFSNRRHQRHRIYVIGIFFTVITMLCLNYFQAPTEILALLVSSLVTVVTFAAVNLWWKISVHTSTAAAMVVILHIIYGWWAVPSLLIVPAMGWARVRLAQHTLGQVIIGALASAGIVILVFTLYGVL